MQFKPIFLWVATFALLLAACDVAQEAPDVSYDGPPLVTLVSPLINDVYRVDAAVNILIRVENAGPDIERVAVTINGATVGEVVQPNPSGAAAFAVTNLWNAPQPGSYAINAVAERADGTLSEIASVSVDVVPDAQTISEPLASATPETVVETIAPIVANPQATPTVTIAAQVLEATATATVEAEVQAEAMTMTPAPSTPTQPQVRVNTGANVRSGPSTIFAIAGSYAAGTVADALAVAPGGLWYKIEYYNGEAWIAAQLIDVIGDASSLPIEVGPPTPVPVTNTPVPTDPPAAVADLSIVFWSPPDEMRCGEATTATITIANSGSGPSGATGVILEDLHNGNVQTTASANIQSLGPNENVTVDLTLTATTFVFEQHTLRVRVDPNGSVAELDENNNSRSQDFVLASGGC